MKAKQYLIEELKKKGCRRRFNLFRWRWMWRIPINSNLEQSVYIIQWFWKNNEEITISEWFWTESVFRWRELIEMLSFAWILMSALDQSAELLKKSIKED